MPPDHVVTPFSGTKIAIIGGGITGLAAAHRLVELADAAGRSDVEFVLYEAGERFGGVFGTQTIDDYRVEFGADSFITNKPWAIDLCRRLSLDERLISTNPAYRRSLVLHRGKPVETPNGFHLLAPGRIWPMLTTPLLSPMGKLRMAAERFIRTNGSHGDESLAAFVRRRFGQELLDRIVQPMVGGIYTSDPETLSLKATLPQFIQMEKDHGSLTTAMRKQNSKQQQNESTSGARYGLFATPRNGMQELLDRLVDTLRSRVTLTMSSPVQSIGKSEAAFTIMTEEGESATADGVVLALPTYRSSALLAGLDADLSEALSEIDYASSAIVLSGHRLSDIEHPINAFGLVIPHVENRQILAVSFLSRKFEGRAPEGHAVLRTFVGGAMQPEQLEKTDEQIIEMVMRELREILGVKSDPTFVRIARYHKAMPQYTVGHLERVERIRSLEAKHEQIALASNGFRGVGIPDCIHSGELAAEKVWTNVAVQSVT